MTLSLIIPSRSHNHRVKYNKKLAIKNFVSKYKVPFDIDDDAIDLRTMAENYTNGIVPLEDIAQALDVLAGPGPRTTANLYDPQDPHSLSPRFGYVSWQELYLMPIFQRDVMWNHIKKIFQFFDPSCVSVPCAIKITIDGKVYYLVWDGHHTLQVCNRQNYKSYPIWYIDIDVIPQSEIDASNVGGSTPEERRIRYGIWKAGNNMRNINSKLKRSLHPYDDFMIGYETGDPVYNSVMNIYKKYKVTPKRHHTGFRGLSSHKTTLECYDLADKYGNRGRYLDRSLSFHTTHWNSPITIEIYRPMSYLYQLAETQGFVLDEQFDQELGDLLINLYGDSESAQAKIKESYWTKLSTGNGVALTQDKQRVLSGLINLYNQHVGRLKLPAPEWIWQV